MEIALQCLVVQSMLQSTSPESNDRVCTVHARNWLSNDLLTGADQSNETQEETSIVLRTKKRYGAESNRIAAVFQPIRVLDEGTRGSLRRFDSTLLWQCNLGSYSHCAWRYKLIVSASMPRRFTIGQARSSRRYLPRTEFFVPSRTIETQATTGRPRRVIIVNSIGKRQQLFEIRSYKSGQVGGKAIVSCPSIQRYQDPGKSTKKSLVSARWAGTIDTEERELNRRRRFSLLSVIGRKKLRLKKQQGKKNEAPICQLKYNLKKQKRKQPKRKVASTYHICICVHTIQYDII